MITEPYRQQLIELHKSDPRFGVIGEQMAPAVAKILNDHNLTELLDYGCGKLGLLNALKGKLKNPTRFQAYDPAGDEELRNPPTPMQMVACLDVLEHVEPEYVDSVLDDIERCAQICALISVSTTYAHKNLPDGRNVHLSVHPDTWWLPKIMERFVLHVFQKTADGFFVLCMAKDEIKSLNATVEIVNGPH